MENQVLDCLYNRASVRSFKDKDISEDIMNKILDAGCHSATGGNLQPYSIIEIRSNEQKQALMDTGEMQSIVLKAPVTLLFCIDLHRNERWAKLNHAPYTARDSYRHFWISLQDTVIAAQNCCTAADSLGLGSVYLGTVESCFYELKEMFSLPEGVFPVVLLCLGYPDKYPDIAPKHLHDIIVHKERYQELSDEDLNKAMDKKYDHKKKTPLSERNLKELEKVCKNVKDDDFAKKALAYAKNLGYIHEAQRYFALHYPADQMPLGNDKFLETLRKYGFTWPSSEH